MKRDRTFAAIVPRVLRPAVLHHDIALDCASPNCRRSSPKALGAQAARDWAQWWTGSDRAVTEHRAIESPAAATGARRDGPLADRGAGRAQR